VWAHRAFQTDAFHRRNGVEVSTEQLLAGRYQLEGMLGSGGMGEVHRAWDTHLRRFVALKLFPATSDATARQRFDNEIHLMARLSHPNLVVVYDAGTSDDLSFVALRLVDGPTLRDQIACAPLSPEETRVLGAYVADGLAHVHANGVVHRDVKPSNILLDVEGMPYLADFGLARLTGSTRLTKCDELVGTAAYLAPEQVRGGDVGPAADIYALGLVLLECLTGRCEYDGNEIEAAVARLHRPPLVPSTLPADLARLLTLMTSLAPHRRPTAEECAHALRDPAGAVTAVAPVGRPGATKRFLVAAAIGALAVTGVSLAAFSGPPPAVSEPTPSPAPQPSPQQAVVTHTTTVVVPAPTTQRPKPATTPTRKGNSGPGNSVDKSKGKKPDRPDNED
jgi:eukaryotic-like serine/threonine-protein kinase